MSLPRSLSLAFALCFALCSSAQAQLETRGNRDAAGIREQMVDLGETAPTLDELSVAYDRASASWLEVFGPAPFESAAQGARRAIEALAAKGWSPRAHVVVSMLDARGDAAWEEDGSCRAQLNVGSDGSSPVSKALGPGAFEFLAAHELSHCLFDQTAPADRFPLAADLLAPAFPLRLTPSQARSIASMLANPSSDDGSQGLAEAYDEALADTLATSSVLALDPFLARVVSRALALRMGALSMAARDQVGPPPHLGAYAIWTSLSGRPARSLPEARALATASALIHSLSATPARWSQSLREADPRAYRSLVAQARHASIPIHARRDREADETAYLSARHPSLFIMDLSSNSSTVQSHSAHARPELTAEESLDQWRKTAWFSTR